MFAKSQLGSLILLVVLGLLPSAPASALTGSGFEPIVIPKSQTQKIRVMTRGASPEGLSLTRGLELLQNQLASPQEAIQRMLRDGGASELLQINVSGENPGFSLVGDQSAAQDIEFAINGVPLCDLFHVRAKKLANGSLSMLGALPTLVDHHPIPDGEWPYYEDALAVAKAFVQNEMGESRSKLESRSRCYAVENGYLYPAYEIRMLNGEQELPVSVYADAAKVYDYRNQYFSIVGTSKVFRNNPDDDEMVIVTLPGLIGDGTLTTKFLRADVADFEPYDRAVNEDHEFFYDTKSDEYVETAAFTYAQLHYDFMKKLGFKWYGPRPMDVRIHEKPNGQVNNALFVPAATDTTLPRIEVGDGDDIALQGLPKDADVIAHEFGHHVVYRTLQDTKDDSLALHEGLADFFAFARTGDDCLGESICPNGSEACWVASKCLRTANNNLNYQDPIFGKLGGHFQGQLISGMLWDMRTSNAIAKDDLNTLVFKAIEYFPKRASFSDFLFSLLAADNEMFDKAYEEAIYEAGNARGLGDLFKGWEPGEEAPLPSDNSESLTNNDQKRPSSGTKQTKSDGGASCAVNPAFQNHGTLGTLFILLLLLGLPLLAPTRSAIKARVKTRGSLQSR